MMKLSTGMTAPAFETVDVFGNPISLRAYAGKGLLLSFFRNGACAICNLQVHHLIEKYPEYRQHGLEIVAVFESPQSSILQYVGKQNAPFPIVADPQAVLYDLYGVESSEAKVMAPADMEWRSGLIAEAKAIGYELTKEEGSNFFRLPADFLIGPDQRICAVHYSETVGTHLSFAEIEQFVAQLA
jgi:thioredoxin-dependent peroxiredoxin